jgi:hypothetical protein
MTNQGIDIQHPKLRGEWAEMRFMARAAEHGFSVAKPWGEMARYDFAVEHRGRFLRVQVKSTKCRQRGSYKCHVTASGVRYGAEEVDFFAAYVIPADVWFIIPRTATNGQEIVFLAPHRRGSKYGKYIEAWELLKGAR